MRRTPCNTSDLFSPNLAVDHPVLGHSAQQHNLDTLSTFSTFHFTFHSPASGTRTGSAEWEKQ